MRMASSGFLAGKMISLDMITLICGNMIHPSINGRGQVGATQQITMVFLETSAIHPQHFIQNHDGKIGPAGLMHAVIFGSLAENMVGSLLMIFGCITIKR